LALVIAKSNRKTYRRCVFALGALLSFAPVCLGQSVRKPDPIDIPSYSTKATTIYDNKSATSPDGKKKVSIRRLQVRAEDTMQPAELVVRSEKTRLSATTRFGLDAEVLWSPDSLAFSLTGSREGANGQYGTDVFYIRGGGLVKIELNSLLETTFGHPVKCAWPEVPNVGAILWLVPSEKLLVAAEIVHHSVCDSFGTFRAYAVDLTGPRIVATYDQLEAKRLYRRDLGGELLQADDSCIRDPKSCWVMGNHQ